MGMTSGIWFRHLPPPDQRQRDLDWFHLSENLTKLGSRRQLERVEALLWNGNVAMLPLSNSNLAA
jgi:hypothetical protein